MSLQIAVFGGSQPKPGEPAYQQALHLGRLLAQAGYTILNGGYIGSMEAVSRGAAEVNGRVIGVTCDEIEAWRPVKANPWVTETWHFPSLKERIFALIENADAYLALPGGVGTMTEVMLTWNLLLTRILPARMLILIGLGWRRIIQEIVTEHGEHIPVERRRWVIFTPDVESAFQRLQETLSDDKLLSEGTRHD
ncbi:MAG: LOG family protein [Acidobacteriaceae bacterium]